MFLLMRAKAVASAVFIFCGKVLHILCGHAQLYSRESWLFVFKKLKKVFFIFILQTKPGVSKNFLLGGANN